MKKLGVITIGEAPRDDIQPAFEQHLRNTDNILQVGVLDGITIEEAERLFEPVMNEYTMTTKYRNGDSIKMSRNKITPVIQQKIDFLEEQGCGQILLLCTGVFYGLTTKKALFIEPEKMIIPIISNLVKDHKLGIIGPLPIQREILAEKWSELSQSPVYCSASPYTYNENELRMVARRLKEENVSLILLDCMGYIESMKRVVQEEVGTIPVVLSNALLVKMISELMD